MSGDAVGYLGRGRRSPTSRVIAVIGKANQTETEATERLRSESKLG
jgi:hypothetical protein